MLHGQNNRSKIVVLYICTKYVGTYCRRNAGKFEMRCVASLHSLSLIELHMVVDDSDNVILQVGVISDLLFAALRF